MQRDELTPVPPTPKAATEMPGLTPSRAGLDALVGAGTTLGLADEVDGDIGQSMYMSTYESPDDAAAAGAVNISPPFSDDGDGYVSSSLAENLRQFRLRMRARARMVCVCLSVLQCKPWSTRIPTLFAKSARVRWNPPPPSLPVKGRRRKPGCARRAAGTRSISSL